MNNPGFYYREKWFNQGELVEVTKGDGWKPRRLVGIDSSDNIIASNGTDLHIWSMMRKRLPTFSLNPPPSFVDFVRENQYHQDGDLEWHAKRLWNAANRAK